MRALFLFWPGQLSAHHILHFVPVLPRGVWKMKCDKHDATSFGPLLHREISTAALRTFPLTIRGGETIILTIAYAKARTMIALLAFPFALNSFVIHTHLFLAYSTRIITHFQKARKTAIQKVWQAKGPFFSRLNPSTCASLQQN